MIWNKSHWSTDRHPRTYPHPPTDEGSQAHPCSLLVQSLRFCTMKPNSFHKRLQATITEVKTWKFIHRKLDLHPPHLLEVHTIGIQSKATSPSWPPTPTREAAGVGGARKTTFGKGFWAATSEQMLETQILYPHYGA